MGEGHPAAWLTDPTGRHEHRYWDGSQWTDQVSDKGVTATDAPTLAASRGRASGAHRPRLAEAMPALSPDARRRPRPPRRPRGGSGGGAIAAAVLVLVVIIAAAVGNSGGGQQEHQQHERHLSAAHNAAHGAIPVADDNSRAEDSEILWGWRLHGR